MQPEMTSDARNKKTKLAGGDGGEDGENIEDNGEEK